MTPSSHSHLIVSFEFVTGQVSVSIYYTEELLNSLRGEHFVYGHIYVHKQPEESAQQQVASPKV